MAQRTGDKRFLATILDLTSARVVLALVGVGGVLLVGCGGGSSDTSSEDSPNSVSTAKASDSSTVPTEKKSNAESKAEALAQGASSPAASTQDTNKHGRHIAQPKGPKEIAPTPADIAHATVADMTLESPRVTTAIEGVGVLPAAYTCDGTDTWPALRWSGVPADTNELALFAMSLQPVEGKLFVDWAVAGLDPTVANINEGGLPPGAVVGTNSFGKRGYSICPAGQGETYMFAVYALPKSLNPARGFDARELRKEVLAASGNVGLLPVAYVRN